MHPKLPLLRASEASGNFKNAIDPDAEKNGASQAAAASGIGMRTHCPAIKAPPEQTIGFGAAQSEGNRYDGESQADP